MCLACVCSHVCYAHCVQICTHVCKHVCGFPELMLCVFFFITLFIVVKQYDLSNLDFTKSRHSCQPACLGDLTLCGWRAANTGSPYPHRLAIYMGPDKLKCGFLCLHSKDFIYWSYPQPFFSNAFLPFSPLLLHIAFHHVKIVQRY